MTINGNFSISSIHFCLYTPQCLRNTVSTLDANNSVIKRLGVSEQLSL